MRRLLHSLFSRRNSSSKQDAICRVELSWSEFQDLTHEERDRVMKIVSSNGSNGNFCGVEIYIKRCDLSDRLKRRKVLKA